MKPTFAMSAPVMKVQGLTANISLPESLFYTNQKSTVQSIRANFDDGKGYQNISYDTPIQVKYDQEGMYTWLFRLRLTNGEVLEAHTKMIFKANHTMEEQQDEYDTEQITATKGYLGVTGTASLQIIDRHGDGLRNPLIIAEGFDPAILEPESVYGINDLESFLRSASFGDLPTALNLYDIIYVNWDDSFAPIQRNAYVLEEVINYVNQKKTGNNQNVVLGQSMGGLAARYALKDMENDPNQAHDTWLYASHDAPHQGANIPLGFQYLDRHVYNQFVQSPILENLVVGLADGAAVLYDVQTMFDAYSARQMLKNYVNNNYQVNNQVHEDWQNELKQMGYPTQTRNIAISNGNHCAEPEPFNPGDQLFKVKGNVRSGWLSDLLLTVFPLDNNFIWTSTAASTYEPNFLLGVLPGSNKIKADFWARALPQNGSEQVYRGFMSYTKKVAWLISITIHITNKNFNSPSNTLPFDYYTGGKYDTPVSIDNQNYQNVLFQYNIEGNMQESFSFVPTPSALDVGEGDVTLNDNDYKSVYMATAPPAAPKNIPFDNFTTSYNDYDSSINEVHISFNTRNGNWLAHELENDPTIFDCSFICADLYEISGPDSICDNSTYSINMPAGASVTWSVSPSNAATFQQGQNPTTFSVNTSEGGDFEIFAKIKIEAQCDKELEISKTVTIGTPFVYMNSMDCTNPYDTLCMFNLYSNTYPIIATLQLDTEGNGSGVGYYDWEWEREFGDFEFIGPGFPQNNGEKSIGSTATLQVNSNQVIQFKARAKNECGWGLWKYFVVYPSTSYAGRSANNYSIYPNPTSGQVNIENMNVQSSSITKTTH